MKILIKSQDTLTSGVGGGVASTGAGVTGAGVTGAGVIGSGVGMGVGCKIKQ